MSGVAEGLVDWILFEELGGPLQTKWFLGFRLVLSWPLYIVNVLSLPLLQDIFELFAEHAFISSPELFAVDRSIIERVLIH